MKKRSVFESMNVKERLMSLIDYHIKLGKEQLALKHREASKTDDLLLKLEVLHTALLSLIAFEDKLIQNIDDVD